MTEDLYFGSIDEKFGEILETSTWRNIEADFEHADAIFIIGNGGNLAIADHAAADISRLTDKPAFSPGSGILVSSLINETTYRDWLTNWMKIQIRKMSIEQIRKSLVIGISSSGHSYNVIDALAYHHYIGGMTALITALDTDDNEDFIDHKSVLNVEAYHTAEVLTLLLTYQLIKAAGYECPLIREKREKKIFYKKYVRGGFKSN